MHVQKYRCKKDTIRWTSQGSFFYKSLGHVEGPDFKPFVTLARVPVDFKVVFGRLFFDIWKLSKMVENGSGVSFDRFLGRPEADLKGGSGGR